MKFLPIALLLFACSQTKPDPMPTLNAVKDNLLHFSDGGTREIPHWGDSSYVTLFFVRHCERGMHTTNDPELTAEGQARAERLGRIMAECALDSVYATPYKRTRQTAEPVQRRSGCPPTITYLPENQIDLLEQLVSGARGKQIFIVGHQNTVPMALNYLKGDFVYRNIPDFEFGKFYVAVVKEVGEAEVMELTY